MITKKEIKKLESLAHIEIKDKNLEQVCVDLEKILEFVSRLKAVQIDKPSETEKGEINIVRGDKKAHESGIFTEALLKEVPEAEKAFVKTRKVM